MKSLLVSYLLWFVLGIYGVHHFYLRRDRHAFIWWCSMGGFLGVGWLRDLWRLPDYVREANEDEEEEKEKEGPSVYQFLLDTPKFSVARFSGEMAVGMLFGLLVESVIPTSLMYRFFFLHLLSLAGLAVGVHLVANIGRERCPFKVPLLGAYVVVPLMILNGAHPENSISWAALSSTVAANWKGKRWASQPRRKKHLCVRFAWLAMAASVYASLWGCVLYHNVSITTRDGEKILLKDAVENFLASPAWSKTKETMWELWEDWKEHGTEHTFHKLMISLDPEGEDHAYEVLGLSDGATEKEITAAYRSLVKRLHPDVNKDDPDASAKFQEVQQAYEKLSKIKSRRSQQNERQRRKDEL